MAPPSKDGRIRLLEPLASDFAAFRAAMGMGVTEIGVIREAVRAFIDDKIAKDRELRRRYEAERERLRTVKVRPLRIVKSDEEP
jgi:hypothetical protein